jgi:tetratricopeptide (TPR) repeat protein
MSSPGGSPSNPPLDAGVVEKRLLQLEVKMNIIIWLAIALLGGVGAAYYKMLDMAKDTAALSVKISYLDSTERLKAVSPAQLNADAPAAKAFFQEVDRLKSGLAQLKNGAAPVPPALYYELGEFEKNNHRPKEAIEYFGKAVEGNPSDFRALTELGGQFLILAEDYPEKKVDYATRAIDPLGKAIAINSRYGGAFNNLGIAYYLSGLPDNQSKAIEAFSKAMELNPSTDEPYYNLACLYAQEKQPPLALRYLKLAVDHGLSTIDDLKRDEGRCFQGIKKNPAYVALRDEVDRRSKRLN